MKAATSCLPARSARSGCAAASTRRRRTANIGARAKSRPGNWESLGDMGWKDTDGYVYLSDRDTDMILVGGANVYPAEIESALDEHPAVTSSCVIGLPDDEYGSVVHAIVQAAGPLTSAELDEFLCARSSQSTS